MKMKRILPTICAVALVAAMGTTAYAANEKQQGGRNIVASTTTNGERQIRCFAGERGLPPDANLTDEEKAELEAKRAEMKEKFAGGLAPDANLTDEQKAELEAKRAEMETKIAEQKAKFEAQQAAWNALTAEQKEEVYKLNDAEIDARIATIDKYVSLGLMTADDAASMKEKMTAEKAAVRESGNMPFLGQACFKAEGGNFGFGMRGGERPAFGVAPADGATPTAPASASAATSKAL